MGTLAGLMARKIIIDTDPGQDDALAMLLAFGFPEELDVLGITCVAGNVPLSYTTRNALLICELAGRTSVPVFAGCSRPEGCAPPREPAASRGTRSALMPEG